MVQKKICLLRSPLTAQIDLLGSHAGTRFGARYRQLIGCHVSRLIVDLEFNRQRVFLSLMVWDVAAGVIRDRLRKAYYRGAAGALLVAELDQPGAAGIMGAAAAVFRQICPRAPLVLFGYSPRPDFSDMKTIGQFEAVAAQFGMPWFAGSTLPEGSLGAIERLSRQMLVGGS